MGHVNKQIIRKLADGNVAIGVTISKASTLKFCENCVEDKMQRKPFKPVGKIRSTQRLQRIHSDVCGPMPTESIGGHKYFVTVIDDYSRCCKVFYLLRNKSQVLERFKEFEALVTNECGNKIGALRSDNGGEYISKDFEDYLKIT